MGQDDEPIVVSDGSGSDSSRRVLIIDDEVEIGRLIARIASSAGCAPTVVTDPAEFMALFEQLRPVAVTIDILMPKVDGIELVAWLLDRSTDVRIVIVSGSDPLYAEIADLMATSRRDEGVCYLPKPLDVKALAEIFESV